jgi:hypothetical protein
MFSMFVVQEGAVALSHLIDSHAHIYIYIYIYIVKDRLGFKGLILFLIGVKPSF